MCAIEAGKRGRRVAVLERSERCGKKILISGGGRCNFTNPHCTPENFLSANPHFAKSALARYTPADFISLVEKHRIPYHEKTLGQLFCDGSSREILHMLEAECQAAGVRILVRHRCGRRSLAARILCCERTSAEFRAPVLVVATGGLSIPEDGCHQLWLRSGATVRTENSRDLPGPGPAGTQCGRPQTLFRSRGSVGRT